EAGSLKQITAADPAVEGGDVVWQAAGTSGLDPATMLMAGGALLGAALVAHAHDDGGGSREGAAPEVNTTRGQVVAGPVTEGNDLKVTIYQADGVTKLGEGVVDADGRFSISVGNYRGVVVAQVTNAGPGNDYLDEATGVSTDLTSELFAVGVITEANSVVTLNLNPLTTVASRKAFEAASGEPLEAASVVAINKA